MGRIVLIGGSRHATTAHVELIAAALAPSIGPAVLRHGGAPGVDTLAAGIVQPWGWTVEAFPAAWEVCDETLPPELGGCPDWPHRQRRRTGSTYCPYAGHRRNQQMVDAYPHATEVQVFPARSIEDRSGTRDLWMRAIHSGRTVHDPISLNIPTGGRHAAR